MIVLGTVQGLDSSTATATVRMWLARGGVAEATLLAVNINLLRIGAVVAVAFTGGEENLSSGVVLGAVSGAELPAALLHGHSHSIEGGFTIEQNQSLVIDALDLALGARVELVEGSALHLIG